MPIYRPLLTLTFLLAVALFHAQSLIDTHFSDRNCEASEIDTSPEALRAPDEICTLNRWRSIGGTRPRILQYEKGPLISINLGAQVREESAYRFYREYIQADISAPLEHGIWYCFRADMKARPEATVGISDFEVFFGREDVSAQLSAYENSGVVPQIRPRDEVIPYAQFDYRREWKTIERYFKAEGGERFLIIGNFYNGFYGISNISHKVFDYQTGSNLPAAAYYLRNIELTRIEPPQDYYNEVPDKLQRGDKITLTTIQFAVNESVIEPASHEEIEQMAQAIITSKASIRISGHTDDTGEAAANLRLSEERALALSRLLVYFGVENGRISTEGKGETEPVADNDSPEGRAQNRRVEIEIF